MYELKECKTWKQTTASEFIATAIKMNESTNGGNVVTKSNDGKEFLICNSDYNNVVIMDRWDGKGICVLTTATTDEYDALKELQDSVFES